MAKKPITIEESSVPVKSYFITWEIEVTAKDPIDAARIAFEMQQDPDTLATCFKVTEQDGEETITIDLLEEDAKSAGKL